MATHTVFHRFHDLPERIRTQIWTDALYSPTVCEALCPEYEHGIPLAFHAPSQHFIGQTCSEARSVMQEVCQRGQISSTQSVPKHVWITPGTTIMHIGALHHIADIFHDAETTHNKLKHISFWMPRLDDYEFDGSEEGSYMSQEVILPFLRLSHLSPPLETIFLLDVQDDSLDEDRPEKGLVNWLVELMDCGDTDALTNTGDHCDGNWRRTCKPALESYLRNRRRNTKVVCLTYRNERAGLRGGEERA